MRKHTLSPQRQRIIEITETVHAGIWLMNEWTSSHQLLERLYQTVEMLEDDKAYLAWRGFRDVLRRNPPHKAVAIINQIPELFREMDELEQQEGEQKAGKKPLKRAKA